LLIAVGRLSLCALGAGTQQKKQGHADACP
jgi:hypothetical protein